ncbi:ABC transporter permease [Halocatena halophila]|uniref:ABC transporter permease n=1 Tax=Halocatena halophila TaxID=2814576 RepID=UPI002ED66FA7
MSSRDDAVDLEELFESSDEYDPVPRAERLRRWLDLSVLAPARVAINDWRALIGTIILGCYLVVGTVGVVVVERPYSDVAPRNAPPFQNLEYILGTDTVGQPIGALLVHATPAMLKMIFAGAMVSVGLAALVGLLSGFMRDTLVDTVLMSITDVIITIPGLPLVIVLLAIFEPENPYMVGVLLGLDNWPGLARTVRSQVLSIREEAYVEASKIMGLSTLTILRRDLLGQLMPYITINSALSSRRIIFESVGLYFIGVLPFTTFNWGVMMNMAYQNHALTRPDRLHYLLFPMATIFLMSFGLVLFSQGMDSVFNVRLQARHASTTDGEVTSDE